MLTGKPYQRNGNDQTAKRRGRVRELERATYVAPRRAPPPETEGVLAIPKSHYEQILPFQGLRRDNGRIVRELVDGPRRYIPRTEAEEDDNHKQVVTYVLVTHGAKVLSFRRGMFNRAAAFLRGSLCIGFGGHVSAADLTLFSSTDAGIRANAERELSEEVIVSGGHGSPKSESFQVVGIINDEFD